MSWTKRQFVVEAFDEIGFASYIYDLEPERLEKALRSMDSMVATWNAKGIRIGYPLPSSQSASSLDQETNVPDSANDAITLNLAVRIAPSLGKVVSQETKQFAKDAYNALLVKLAHPIEMQLPSMPSGAGNKTTDRQFLPQPTDEILADRGDTIEFN